MNLKLHKILKYFSVVLSLWVIWKYNKHSALQQYTRSQEFYSQFLLSMKYPQTILFNLCFYTGKNKDNNICFLSDENFSKIHRLLLKTDFEVLGERVVSFITIKYYFKTELSSLVMNFKINFKRKDLCREFFLGWNVMNLAKDLVFYERTCTGINFQNWNFLNVSRHFK